MSIELLDCAVTSKVFMAKRELKQQQIEWLGDAVLLAVARDVVLEVAPINSSISNLTEYANKLVNNEFLCEISVRLGVCEKVSGIANWKKPARELETKLAELYLSCGFEAAKDFIYETLRNELLKII